MDCYSVHQDYAPADYTARKEAIDAELIELLMSKPPGHVRLVGEPFITTFTLAPQSRTNPSLELRVEAQVQFELTS